MVSCSDGEGVDAGIGICIDVHGKQPRAAYTRVHPVVRRLWAQQHDDGKFNDIFQVEAVGPLLVAFRWGQELRDEYWLHFTSNTASQQSIVNGSSSIAAGDIIAGHTWRLVSMLETWLWIDRV